MDPAVSGATQEEATLVFLGDVALGRSMEAQLLRYGPAYPWVGLGSLLGEADLAVANLECVLTTQGQPLAKRYVIRAHPYWGQVLDEAGIDLVTVANNHALDYGQAGLDEMLAVLRGLAIETVGAGSSEDPGQAHRPALFTLNGVRVAVLGYAAPRWNGSDDVPATDRLAWATRMWCRRTCVRRAIGRTLSSSCCIMAPNMPPALRLLRLRQLMLR